MKLISLLMLLLSSVSFAADTFVSGYYRSNGTYVQPHYRSAPNDTKLDNYSTSGNTNPYTGQQGTVNPYSYGNTQLPQSNNPYINGIKQNNSWGN